MKIFLLITLSSFIITSCQNIQNVENKKKKSLNKEFSISIEPNVKVNKWRYFQQLILKIKSV